MKRAFFGIVGAIFIVLGIGVAGTGGTIAAVTGSDSAISATAGRVAGNGYALVFNEFTINTVTEADVVRNFADFTLNAKSQNGKELFVGVGSTEAVNNYLQTTAREVVSDLSDGRARVVPIPGNTVPAKPAEQTFWTAKAQGMDPTISLAQQGSNQTLVVMNLDATPQVSAEIILGISSAAIYPFGLSLVAIGIAVLMVGVWLMVIAFKPRKPEPTHYAPLYPPLMDAAPTDPPQAQPAQPAPVQPGPPAAPNPSAAESVSPAAPPTPQGLGDSSGTSGSTSSADSSGQPGGSGQSGATGPTSQA